jgi:hypothetical protein
MTTMTKSILGFLAVALMATTLTPEPGEAAPYWPWCSQYADQDTAHTSCAFISWEQCMETARGMGGYCYANPSPPPAPAGRSAKARTSTRKGGTPDN